MTQSSPPASELSTATHEPGTKLIGSAAEGKFEDDEPEPLSFAPARLRQMNETTHEPAPALEANQQSHPTNASTSTNRLWNTLQDGVQDEGSLNAVVEFIVETSNKLLERAEQAATITDKVKLAAYAKRMRDIPHLPVARRYLEQPGIARSLAQNLLHYKIEINNDPSQSETVRDDVWLKASATAINASLRIGYWKSNPRVPSTVRSLLSSDKVYEAILDISQAQRSLWFEQALTKYNTIVEELIALGTSDTARLKIRNPVLWSWAKYNIDKLMHYPNHGVDVHCFQRMSEAKLMLTLIEVLLDDIADCVQDASLLDIMISSCRFDVTSDFVQPELERRLRSHGRDHFLGYLRLVFECWQSTLSQIRQTATDAFDILKPSFMDDYDSIFKALYFCSDLNSNPFSLFQMKPTVLARHYGATNMEDITAHGVIRMAFFTLDLMTLRASSPDLYDQLHRSGTIAIHRKSSWLFQHMHRIGNAVSTGAREVESDDLSNGIFKLANDLLNAWPTFDRPVYLGSDELEPKDTLIRLFQLKREVRKKRDQYPSGSPPYIEADDQYKTIAHDIEYLVELSGAESIFFDHWLRYRNEATQLLMQTMHPSEAQSLLDANDMLLVLHLIYKGKI